MSTIHNLNRAAARAEVKTVTPANVNIGNTFSYTINGKTITVTAAAATVANVTGLAVTALNASTIPEFAAITWSDSTTHVTGTHDTPGTPFVLTSSAAGGTATNTTATTTAATGPNHWDDANNWSGGAVPITGDEVDVDLSKGSFLYGFAQSAVTLARLYVYRSTQTSNRLGLPIINASGYTEYLPTALAIGATEALYDADCPYAVDHGSVQSSVEILRAPSSFSGLPDARLWGTNASNAWEIAGGVAAIGLFSGVASNGATLRVGRNGGMVCGPDVVIVDVTNAGQLEYRGTFTDFTNEDGQASIYGVQAASSLVITGGTVYKRYSGTIADVDVGPGILDASLDLSPATHTNTAIHLGGEIYDPEETITHTNQIERGPGVSRLTAT